MSGASNQANGRASSLVPTSWFFVVLNDSKLKRGGVSWEINSDSRWISTLSYRRQLYIITDSCLQLPASLPAYMPACLLASQWRTDTPSFREAETNPNIIKSMELCTAQCAVLAFTFQRKAQEQITKTKLTSVRSPTGFLLSLSFLLFFPFVSFFSLFSLCVSLRLFVLFLFLILSFLLSFTFFFFSFSPLLYSPFPKGGLREELELL